MLSNSEKYSIIEHAGVGDTVSIPRTIKIYVGDTPSTSPPIQRTVRDTHSIQ